MVTGIEKLVRQFAENVMAQTEAMRRCDAKAGNEHVKRYVEAFRALRALGDEGRNALVPLMFEGRDDVRRMTAAFLLRFRHDAARRVLEELARGEGFGAFAASEALKRWEEGTWQLDPPDEAGSA